MLDQAAYVEQAPRPAIRADAQRLPFTNGSFGAIAALWMLYHVHDPQSALVEAARCSVREACSSPAHPAASTVELFLRGRGLPQQLAEGFSTPLRVTKRGVQVWATRR